MCTTDYLHNPDPKRDKKSDKGGTIFTLVSWRPAIHLRWQLLMVLLHQRGLMNLGCLVTLIVALVTLFAGPSPSPVLFEGRRRV